MALQQKLVTRNQVSDSFSIPVPIKWGLSPASPADLCPCTDIDPPPSGKRKQTKHMGAKTRVIQRYMNEYD